MGAKPSALRKMRGRHEEVYGRHRHRPLAGLPHDELHVWRASLDLAPEIVSRLGAWLSAGELARADRFHFERDRRRYIAGRGQLRMVLGRYLARAAQDVRFAYGPNEKPFLDPTVYRGRALWFNLSHSGPVALMAVSSGAEVGIDVELEGPDLSRERIAERFFSAAEVTSLRSLPAEQQARAFLACWTRKEAFIKARGDGLSLALDSFDVTLAPGETSALRRTAWSPGEPTRWTLADISDYRAGFVAAVASRSRGWRVVHHELTEIIEPRPMPQEAP